MPAVPLSVLDLVPVPSGSTAADAVRDTVDLARRAEAAGYHRYWFAEHHLNPGVAGASPAVAIALVAAATGRIRLGSAGVQLAHRTALATVEEFGLIDALHPGRLDLGLGRSGPQLLAEYARREPVTTPPPANGLPVPAAPRVLAAERVALAAELLHQPGARTPDYARQVADVLALLAGTYRSTGDVAVRAVPGEGAAVQVWVLGSSAGLSAAVAGAHGLRFAANYHISPGSVLETVAAYRAAFVPSAELDRPHVAVSADVVVAPTDAEARRLAAGYPAWVRGIRSARGPIPYPSPAEADGLTWTDDERALVADRVTTQVVGSPATAVARLRQLRDATGADELVITTITHDHRDRVRSYELLAEAWGTAP
ncbi:LLM class flavin-dependent oxidoreductase [Saccharothrix obliqua]|uniref:LLM class flavin-dependent oxidoreductase n=1 Tax=Saccharothrix obliqua TaxID=2861747 RepID=UPI001C5FA0F3|nr:LLM class flavin-dependent oxidoreductase [Saccharothrix obliqua]MBW4721425.1 LLM class flavin-dependent oxidoreductase [Saccharothrix obliqua]